MVVGKAGEQEIPLKYIHVSIHYYPKAMTLEHASVGERISYPVPITSHFLRERHRNLLNVRECFKFQYV